MCIELYLFPYVQRRWNLEPQHVKLVHHDAIKHPAKALSDLLESAA